MKKYNALTLIFLASLTIVSCRNTSEIFFSINEDALKAQYSPNESLKLEVLNLKNKEIDSVVYSINNKKIGAVKGAEKLLFPLKDQKLGYQNLKANIYFEGQKEIDSSRVELISDITPKVLSYTIVNTYPHDHQAYIEGLEFYKDTLYEATGNGEGNDTGIRGISSMRKVDYKTGKVLKKIEYPQEIFGEGISILNGKIYQLTYKQNECYVYDVNTFKKLKTLPYYKPMEGWGMTNDGKNLYYNDGSEKIHIIDPETFQQVDYLNVYSGSSKIPNINELEWVDGKIYSNIYQKDFIIVINPKNGAVEALLDLSDLKNKITKLADVDVLNGIAYNPKTKTFFVTGKNWDKMFEIKIK
ncbi:glutaminyl-peptide cyclotransferase [Flavobacterium sp. SUN052]|uniref:glutaminyl-peptide cyclotransferase n=1 Tax=Flavobacterium sp. SUN052 TaxID=3002441 RepID=UPI00237DE8A2|nr:glutaminyl-peptide cyclotransferase [Flavobacterium sp. SUN052]MEC4005851.1 glutaminyl-peptide cyclotransferase [Flavobacterium sp. SUN052]